VPSRQKQRHGSMTRTPAGRSKHLRQRGSLWRTPDRCTTHNPPRLPNPTSGGGRSNHRARWDILDRITGFSIRTYPSLHRDRYHLGRTLVNARAICPTPFPRFGNSGAACRTARRPTTAHFSGLPGETVLWNGSRIIRYDSARTSAGTLARSAGLVIYVPIVEAPSKQAGSWPIRVEEPARQPAVVLR